MIIAVWGWDGVAGIRGVVDSSIQKVYSIDIRAFLSIENCTHDQNANLYEVKHKYLTLTYSVLSTSTVSFRARVLCRSLAVGEENRRVYIRPVKHSTAT